MKENNVFRETEINNEELEKILAEDIAKSEVITRICDCYSIAKLLIELGWKKEKNND